MQKGVSELKRSSGEHTEVHHLTRCLAPEKDKDDAPATEQRLISTEAISIRCKHGSMTLVAALDTLLVALEI
jgi:hypothetical protein